MAKTSDIRKGMTFKHNGDIFTVVEFQHVKQGRGAGFYRVKMKSLTTGRVLENNFTQHDRIDDIRVERHEYQYSFQEGDFLVFMNMETWEQLRLEQHRIDAIDLLLEGDICEILFNTADNTPLTIEQPPNVIREVTYTEPGLKGDTATNTLKPATVEGGAEIKVPLFITTGDNVKIATATKSYMERI